jgi:hypothetical protein
MDKCNSRSRYPRLLAQGLLQGLVVSLLASGGCMPPSAENDVPRAPRRSDPQERKSILQRSTRDVRDASKELAKEGTQEAKPHMENTNIIRYQFDAALDLTAKVAKIQIKNAVDTFWALNGRYPKDYAEFKREIIDANPTLRLPELPYYQEYGYDPETHELIILEYPDRKKKGR